MVIREDVSVRDAADVLAIDPSVLARLCRYLHIDAADQRIPLHVLERAGQYSQAEQRYAALRSWLLHNCVPARGV